MTRDGDEGAGMAGTRSVAHDVGRRRRCRHGRDRGASHMTRDGDEGAGMAGTEERRT